MGLYYFPEQTISPSVDALATTSHTLCVRLLRTTCPSGKRFDSQRRCPVQVREQSPAVICWEPTGLRTHKAVATAPRHHRTGAG